MIDLLVVENGGMLMIVFSNVLVSEGFLIFGNKFNTNFLGFPQVQNPYKRMQGNGVFCVTGWLLVFGGYVWIDATGTALF